MNLISTEHRDLYYRALRDLSINVCGLSQRLLVCGFICNLVNDKKDHE